MTNLTERPSDAREPGTLVVGLGISGLSCARHLARRGEAFAVADSREQPPGLAALREELPAVPVRLGPFDPAYFAGFRQLVVSPGVPLDTPALATARAAGAALLGDIELFARAARAPVVAITGSNGKSTVTTLVGEMARAAGRAVAVGGNLGTAALDLLDDAADLYVLELSSFQLELTEILEAQAAVVLNVSADHLDRHGSMEHYAALKARVYRGGGVQVLNRDDPRVAAMALPGRQRLDFGVDMAGAGFGLAHQGGETWLARDGRPLLPVAQLRIAGRHNWSNALAALALGSAIGLPEAAMCAALCAFDGLAHRCRKVAHRRGVGWYDDSKGTNVGSTLAALAGMPGERVVLIAGGQGKGQDFAPLRPAVAQRARAVVLIGQDAPVIEAALAGSVPLVHAGSMTAAVAAAADLAREGDTVLLSPACASFDMFTNYMARGEAFAAAARGLPA